MDFLTDILFPVLLYTLGITLLVVINILIIRLIKTLGKIDKVVDDVTYKANKLNGIFDIIDNTTDVLSLASDKIANKIISKLTGLFDRRKKGDED